MAESKKIATRESFGMALCELAKTNEDIVVFDADLSLIHISEPTRQAEISYAVFCLKKKKKTRKKEK